MLCLLHCDQLTCAMDLFHTRCSHLKTFREILTLPPMKLVFANVLVVFLLFRVGFVEKSVFYAEMTVRFVFSALTGDSPVPPCLFSPTRHHRPLRPGLRLPAPGPVQPGTDASPAGGGVPQPPARVPQRVLLSFPVPWPRPTHGPTPLHPCLPLPPTVPPGLLHVPPLLPHDSRIAAPRPARKEASQRCQLGLLRRLLLGLLLARLLRASSVPV